MVGLPPHHSLWLLLAAACGAVDLDTVFFDGVVAERSYDYDLQRDVLGVASTGLPHHKFDVSFEPGVPIKFTTTLPRPEDYVQRGVAFGGRPLTEGAIGVAVNGVAAGAGLSIAISGDLVLAARSAMFTSAYTAAGLSPDGSSTYFMPRLIGLRRSQELMLTNRRLNADEAVEWGLINRVVADDDLMAEAEALARNLASGATGAYGAVKKMLTETFTNPLETQMEIEARFIAERATSPDGREGIDAFVNKRTPDFKGE